MTNKCKIIDINIAFDPDHKQPEDDTWEQVSDVVADWLHDNGFVVTVGSSQREEDV